MRYQHILQAVYFEPWLITAPALASIQSLLESHLTRSALDVAAMREGTGPCGSAVDLEQMEIKDGIAHIPIGGAIGKRLSLMEKGSGAVDVDDITSEIAQAESDPTVQAIIFDIDSPGGMATGVPELAARIQTATKPTFAFTAGTMASAAYWVGSSVSNGIWATQSAHVGSIGVYLAILDQTKRMEQAGVSVEMFKAGTLKGIGFPGVPLTDEQRKHLQARVDNLYSMFTDHVLSVRGDIAKADMQGQTFMAPQALQKGLIDGGVASKDEVIAMALTPQT